MQSDEYSKIHQETVRERAKATERVGWFAGATISLSFSLFGFLVSKRYLVSIINQSPSLSLALILGWVFLSVSVVGSLLIGGIGEDWVRDSASQLYLMGNDQFAKAMNKADPKLLNVITMRTKFKARALSIVEAFVYVSGILGIISLVFFLIQFTLFFVSQTP